jgi:serine/threonine protein kinase
LHAYFPSITHAAMKISKEDWQSLEPLLTEGMEKDGEVRESWLRDLEQTHAALVPLLRTMLQAHDRAERSSELETVPHLAPPPRDHSAVSASMRIGPFRMLRLLGRGGMGEVWLAEQVDGRVERQVALKLPTVHQHSEVWRERFRRERDILAKLAHPNIAKLYDAGVSDEEGSRGQPYLAMEYVEGEALGDYAALHRLSIPARLALFRQILAAVSHAHRHLVVHRDLKPANILIDRSGQVKLLDFGIAKLIDDEFAENAAAALTQLGSRLMTIRYAAPEQVAAGTISTVTDVYALGVILHELLTGTSPYRAVRDGRGLTETVLLAEQPTLPSLLASAAGERGLGSTKALFRVLSGDLDAIILKALRRDPADRYATVEQFDEDIARYLDQRPVKARTGTWRYLAGRFVARHKLPIATGAAVLVTMVAGLVMVELERRVAVTERERAERHFASVRSLANTFMFDVHGELENLAGSLKARQKLVGTALQYLDSLADEASQDTKLALEVATAYRKLAEIKGDGRGANLGEVRSARENATRAAALLETVERRDPENIEVLREHRVLALLLGRLALESGDATGVDQSRKAAELAGHIVSLPGAKLDDRRSLGATLAEYGGILAVVKNEHAAGADQLARAIEQLEAVTAESPGDLRARADLAYAYERAATIEELTGQPQQLARAITLFEKSIAATEWLTKQEPANLLHTQKLVSRYNNAAQAALKAGDVRGARAKAASALLLLEKLYAADKTNVANSTMWVPVLATASEAEFASGNFIQSVNLSRRAIERDAHLPREVRAGLIVRESLSNAWRPLGKSRCAIAGLRGTPPAEREAAAREGRGYLSQSRAFKQELVDRKIDAVDAARVIGELDAELRNCDAQPGVKTRD